MEAPQLEGAVLRASQDQEVGRVERQRGHHVKVAGGRKKEGGKWKRKEEGNK